MWWWVGDPVLAQFPSLFRLAGMQDGPAFDPELHRNYSQRENDFQRKLARLDAIANLLERNAQEQAALEDERCELQKQITDALESSDSQALSPHTPSIILRNRAPRTPSEIRIPQTPPRSPVSPSPSEPVSPSPSEPQSMPSTKLYSPVTSDPA